MGQHIWLSSSIIRIVTTQIQCSFGTYFWEMYTQEFGWTAAEWGIVQTIYNRTQAYGFIVFGLFLLLVDMFLFTDSKPDTAEVAIQLILIVLASIIHICKF